MPVFTLSNMSVVDANVVEIKADISAPQPLFIQAGEYIEVPETPLAVRRGVFSVSIGSLDKNNLSSESSGRTSFNTVPITVEVFKAGNPDPVKSVETMSGPSLAPDPDHPQRSYLTKFDIDAGPAEERGHYTRMNWRIRLTNNTDRIAQVSYDIRYVRDSSLITEQAIPLDVLNNTFGILLHALSPTASLNGRELTVRISPEIAEFSSLVPEDGQMVFNLSDQLPVDARSELVTLKVALVPGSDALREVDDKWQQTDAAIRAAAGGGGTLDRTLTQAKILANNKWRDAWHKNIDPSDIAVKFCVALTDINLVLGHIWTQELSLGEIADPRARIFMIFKSHTAFVAEQFGKGHGLVFTPAHYEGTIAGIADAIGLAPDIGEKIAGFVNDAIPKIHGYFAEVLVHLVHDLYVKRYIDSRIVDDKLLVRFCDDPADPGALPRIATSPEPSSGSGGGAGAGTGTSRRVPRGLGIGRLPGDDVHVHAEGGAAEPEPLGVVPDGFRLGSDESVARLDQVQTMVLVMMENRSFDHMLGRLSRIRPTKGYLCYPDDATNTVPSHSPIRMIPARNIQVGKTYYAINVDPYHGTSHVKTQINDGKMDGFSRDIMTKPDRVDQVPQVPLTYYDETDIPFFYHLADEFMVCDCWFAAPRRHLPEPLGVPVR